MAKLLEAQRAKVLNPAMIPESLNFAPRFSCKGTQDPVVEEEWKERERKTRSKTAETVLNAKTLKLLQHQGKEAVILPYHFPIGTCVHYDHGGGTYRFGMLFTREECRWRLFSEAFSPKGTYRIQNEDISLGECYPDNSKMVDVPWKLQGSYVQFFNPLCECAFPTQRTCEDPTKPSLCSPEDRLCVPIEKVG